MPVEWRYDQAAPPGAAAVLAEARLWPHRSLDRRDFVVFIGATFLLLLVPLFAVLGSAVLWVLLAFLMGVLWAVWIALRANSGEAALTETLTLTRQRISLVRREPKGGVQSWEADPYWVRVTLHPEGGPVEDYLTLNGGGREVELGAFLSPPERVALHGELTRLLAALR